MDWLLYVVAVGAALFIAVPMLCERYSPLFALGGLMLVGLGLKLLI